MALSNGSFETAGALRYEADDWSVSVSTTAGEGIVSFAEFDVDDATQDTETKEAFESGWGTWLSSFAGFYSDLTYAFFDLASNPKPVEDFEDLWGAGPATVDTDTSGPWVLAHGSTLTIEVDGGAAQDIGFLSSQFANIADARPEEVMNAINAQLVGAQAVMYGARIRILTGTTGLGAMIEVTGGSANAVLQFESGLQNGTPDGSPWINTTEFSLAPFDVLQDEFEDFENEWGDGWDHTPDPEDTSDRYDFEAPDAFESGWGSFNHTPDPTDALARFTLGTFSGTGNVESYEGTWSAMTTI